MIWGYWIEEPGRPRITEVSCVAVNTKDVLELQTRLMKNLKGSKSDVNGLDNYNFIGQSTSDLDVEYGVIGRENSKTPTKSSYSNAVYV